MSEELTPKQRRILEFLHEFFQKNGFPPTEREIAGKLKIQWIRAVQKHLAALEKKGYIKREGGSRRSMKILDATIGREIPVLGRIAAGTPITAVENLDGTFLLDPRLAKN